MFYLIDWPGAVNAKLEKRFHGNQIFYALKKFYFRIFNFMDQPSAFSNFFLLFLLKSKNYLISFIDLALSIKESASLFLCALKLFFIHSTNLYLSSSISFATILMFFVFSSLDRFWYLSQYFFWSPCLLFFLIISS